MGNDNPVQKGKQIEAIRRKSPQITDIVNQEEYFATTLENCEFKFTEDGDIFDLGGITLRVYPIPGHTLGSIALYCPEHKALFAGDAMMKNHLLHYGQSLEISDEPQHFIRALSRLSALDVETVWPAHGDAPGGKEVIADTRGMLIDWARNAEPEKEMRLSPPNSIFGKPGSPSYRYEKYKGMQLSYHIGHYEQIQAYMKANGGAVE
jgi:glyoxylase-like metal-dependent hydrolase (beta-lactamase superfamily II)